MAKELLPVTELQLHPLALTTPVMLDEQYQALKLDLEVHPLNFPITLFRGRVIDGRHRLRAFTELGYKDIWVDRMPNNATLTDLETRVSSSEKGRQQSPNQLAIYAYNQYVAGTYSTLAESAKYTGISPKQVSRAKRIAIYHKRPDILQAIFDGNKIDVGVAPRKLLTDSLATLDTWLSEQKAVSVGNTTGIAIREELSETEELLIGQILTLIAKESTHLKEQLANRIYSITKEGELL